jgi:two-component system, NtrC family, sensor kinase
MTTDAHVVTSASSLAAAQIGTSHSPWLLGVERFPQSTPDLFAVVEQPNYRLEYLNRAGRALLGLSADQGIGERVFMEFIAGQSLWTVLNDAVPGAWRTGSWSGEVDLRCEDGREIATSVVVIARAGDPALGTQDCLWFVARDITAVRTAMAGLRRDQWCLRLLLENVPDCIYFKDLESRFVRVSHAMSTRAGFSDPKKMEGKTDFDLFTSEHAQAAFDAEQQIIRTERAVVDVEEKETWSDGRITWVSTTKMPLYNEYGQVIGTYGVSRDITGRKHTEAALAQAQRSLLEASRMAGMAEVASGVLHNIGNAFNSVNTSTALIADRLNSMKVANLGRAVALIQDHSADLGKFLTEDNRGRQLPGYLAQLSTQFSREHQAILDEVRALAKSVEHIKTIIAMQQNYTRASTLLENLSPAELVSEALQISEASLSKHQIDVVQEFSPVPQVRAARHRVLEILVNLVSNAKQAVSDPSLQKRCIRLTLEQAENGNVIFGVIDNGVGIPAENLKRIFSFGFTTKAGGHGYGLHSSAVAAQDMGGSLVAKSDGPGTGAAFYLELPAVKPPQSV